LSLAAAIAAAISLRGERNDEDVDEDVGVGADGRLKSGAHGGAQGGAQGISSDDIGGGTGIELDTSKVGAIGTAPVSFQSDEGGAVGIVDE
jgi:hypothetical protein